jgi:hypothetical protein
MVVGDRRAKFTTLKSFRFDGEHLSDPQGRTNDGNARKQQIAFLPQCGTIVGFGFFKF